MERDTDRLERLVRSDGYRKALGLPAEVTEEYVPLARGEYNINYLFTHPSDGRKLVLRLNCGSQMHLDDQIEYEYRTLKALECTGRTPAAFYVDGTCSYTDHGILVMEYLPGHALDYRTELMYAADILADIHAAPVPPALIPEAGRERTGDSLISPADPLRAVLEECEQMVSVYMHSELADSSTRAALRRMLDKGWARLEQSSAGQGPGFRCIINTELNSTNFLINGPDERNYLVDWEKPLYADPAQDLGHFLAPTTTFWKTDVILTEEEMDAFISRYIDAVDGRFPVSGLRERTGEFTTITCLRGVTWCAMAWVEYKDPSRLITNESTARKLDQYLDPAFLAYIESFFD